MRFYWFSCDKFTCGVETKDNVVIKTCPFLEKFVGQDIKNLESWINSNFKDVKILEL